MSSSIKSTHTYSLRDVILSYNVHFPVIDINRYLDGDNDLNIDDREMDTIT